MAGLADGAGFWRGRQVFLTGHTGFKGSWLSMWLHALGAHVHGYALDPPTTPSLFDVARVAEGSLQTSTIGDIRDQVALAAALQAARPEIVFHLAAQSLVRPSYGDPVETYGVNVLGTVRLTKALLPEPGCDGQDVDRAKVAAHAGDDELHRAERRFALHESVEPHHPHRKFAESHPPA